MSATVETYAIGHLTGYSLVWHDDDGKRHDVAHFGTDGAQAREVAASYNPTVGCTIHAHVGCAKVVAKWDGYRVWSIPDNAPRVAVTLGGTEAEARAAVIVGLREKFCGDWAYAATLIAPAELAAMRGAGEGDWTARPCEWCERNGRYAH